ncbi:MAG: hypothetical protein N2109_12715 [Fimbriimonadales bacterium]|nr:hypothetical protein [Fimbriimonadales bacterium]
MTRREYCSSRRVDPELWRRIALAARISPDACELSDQDAFDLDWMLEYERGKRHERCCMRAIVKTSSHPMWKPKVWDAPQLMAVRIGEAAELLVEVWGVCRVDREPCYIARMPKTRKLVPLAVGDPKDWRPAKPSERVL